MSPLIFIICVAAQFGEPWNCHTVPGVDEVHQVLAIADVVKVTFGVDERDAEVQMSLYQGRPAK